jgi:DNA polymerase-4
MNILASFSPFLEPMGLDEAYLDATGFESIHGSARQMAVKIKQRIKEELGLSASVGIAGNKVVAKVASELSKPDGLLEVTEGKERSFLAPLPVAKLPGIGSKTEQKLNRLGINTIGQTIYYAINCPKKPFWCVW